jgi:hypothetical protein
VKLDDRCEKRDDSSSCLWLKNTFSRIFHCIQFIIYPKDEGFAYNKHIINAVHGILAMHDVELEEMDLKITQIKSFLPVVFSF